MKVVELNETQKEMLNNILNNEETKGEVVVDNPSDVKEVEGSEKVDEDKVEETVVANEQTKDEKPTEEQTTKKEIDDITMLKTLQEKGINDLNLAMKLIEASKGDIEALAEVVQMTNNKTEDKKTEEVEEVEEVKIDKPKREYILLS